MCPQKNATVIDRFNYKMDNERHGRKETRRKERSCGRASSSSRATSPACSCDPGSVELLKGILEKVEFEVASAKDGQEALTKLGITKPSLMIVDVLMPGMDGFAFFKELKKNKETEGIPVLIHTIRKNMEDSFMAMGANGFLSKPVDTGNLFEMISKLSTRPAAAAPAKDAPPKAEEKKH